MIKVKNTKEEADIWCGMTIEPSAYYEIEDYELIRWQNDLKVLTDITSGDLVVNNGTSDITDVVKAINLLKGIDTKEVDTDGRQIVRQAAGKSGWTYFSHPIEFETSKLSSVYSKKSDGSDRSDSSLKLYDASNNEITDSQNEVNAVKTVLLFKPNHDYELIAGSIQQKASPSTDLRIWVVGGIIELGGAYTKEFAGGVNMAFFGENESIKTDGRAAKYMTKTVSGVPYQANQIQVIIKHDAGHQHKLMLMLEYFRA